MIDREPDQGGARRLFFDSNPLRLFKCAQFVRDNT
jgi:hypothetical protein